MVSIFECRSHDIGPWIRSKRDLANAMTADHEFVGSKFRCNHHIREHIAKEWEKVPD